MWRADMSYPKQGSTSRSSKMFGKFDWAGMNNNSNSNQMFREQVSVNSNSMSNTFKNENDNPYDQLNSYESPSNHRLMRGFGLN